MSKRIKICEIDIYSTYTALNQKSMKLKIFYLKKFNQNSFIKKNFLNFMTKIVMKLISMRLTNNSFSNLNKLC